MNTTDSTANAAATTTKKTRGRKPGSAAPNNKPEPLALHSKDFTVQNGQRLVLKIYQPTEAGRFILGRQTGKPSGALLAPEQFDFPQLAARDMAKALRDPNYGTYELMNVYQVVRVNHENGFTIAVREARHSSKGETKVQRVVKPLPGGEEITLSSQEQAFWLADVIEAEANTHVLPEGAADEMEAMKEEAEIQIDSTSEDDSDELLDEVRAA
jgi:hypothetical protein